ncbi:branched-chain amino acid transporter permease [Vagococcus luciliae]|uniref:branched-chain amino acid transporter permease n=1 Tax=Vagococcus luciliae TaxID=2920380 RepID=UPI00214F47CA|nr:AzlD domain-containing protein [Vagococcus luciliae]
MQMNFFIHIKNYTAILFPENKTPPVYIIYLGNVLPYATMGLLVVFCLKDAVTRAFAFPELLAILLIVIIHKWKHSTLLSIGLGTIFYMVLVQHISF